MDPSDSYHSWTPPFAYTLGSLDSLVRPADLLTYLPHSFSLTYLPLLPSHTTLIGFSFPVLTSFLAWLCPAVTQLTLPCLNRATWVSNTCLQFPLMHEPLYLLLLLVGLVDCSQPTCVEQLATYPSILFML